MLYQQRADVIVGIIALIIFIIVIRLIVGMVKRPASHHVPDPSPPTPSETSTSFIPFALPATPPPSMSFAPPARPPSPSRTTVPMPYAATPTLLTHAEQTFFAALRAATPTDLCVCPQVRLANLVHTTEKRAK